MLKTTVAGIELEHPIFNAAGPLDATLEELTVLGESHAAAITMKSCTLEAREGNPEPRYQDIPHGSLNSMGLPNLGYKKYIAFAPLLKKYNKPIIASVSGLSLEDNLTIIQALNDAPVDLIEFNLSCPNVIGKPQMGYDPEQTDDVLGKIMHITKKPLGVKLPPYFDFVHFEQIAAILNRNNVRFVTCINAIGNALVIDPEKEQVIIRPKNGFGGLGGAYVKPTALANVRKFSELLNPTIDIVGVGGISSGTDVFEFILAGATAVQIGTTFMKEKHGCFERIEREFNELMAKKGYETIEDVKGNLKTL
ncbi:MAG: dihydroorotate oxidase [Nanoarchaeota archaeon]|nr:dihydroorotate oxidase [Nanoarchaeota archaeon]